MRPGCKPLRISQQCSAAASLLTAKLYVHQLQEHHYLTSEKCHVALKLLIYFTNKIVRAALAVEFCELFFSYMHL